MTFELISDPPYNLTRCALVFSQFPLDGTDVWVPPREVLSAQYCRLHIIDGAAVLAIVQQAEDTEDGKVRLVVRTCPDRPSNVPALKNRVSWQFHLDADLQGFYRRARKHPLLRSVVKALHGVKPLRPATLFEMAVTAITEQQLSYSIAVQMRSRMVEGLGEKFKFDGRIYRGFPTPQVLAGCRPSDLRAFSLSTRKAEYIIDLAKEVLAGFDIENLKDRSNQEVVETLTSLRGFGRWSAEYFISRGLGRTEVIAVDDLGIQTFIGKYLGSGRRVSAEECRRILTPWAPYQRWVVFYLFCASRLGLLK